jgi:hypothetical protein
MIYFFIQLLPMTIYMLCHLAYPTKNLATTIRKTAPWHLKGKPRGVQHKRFKRYKKPIRELQDKAKNQTLQTYLFPAAFATFKVGCCVESFIRRFSGPPSGTSTTWLSKVRQRFKQLHRWSDLILTLTLLGWITTRQNAWPMLLISLKTCTSTTKDK